MEGATAKLRCELSKAAPVEWRKGPETLRARDRVSLRQDGAVRLSCEWCWLGQGWWRGGPGWEQS